MNRPSNPPGTQATEALAQGFAQHVQRWSRGLGAAPAAVWACGHAAQALSLATSDGQVCLPLAALVDLLGNAMADATADATADTTADATADAMADPAADLAASGRSVADWRRLLIASGVVGVATAARATGTGLPMLLDAQDRLYLRRYFDYEQRLARRLQQAAGVAPVPLNTGVVQSLRMLFANPAPAATDWQQLAVALAVRQHLCVISGGPGTGKTTTVVKLLAVLLAAQPQARIALAAPTGKAAARMLAALQARASELPEALRSQLPARSFTVHRLLGWSPGGGFKHHAGQRLPIDVLVVDEASMLDLALATHLLEAVPRAARIILLGDKDQLAAVEAGAVFAALCSQPRLSAACQRDIEVACGLQPGQLAQPGQPVQPTHAAQADPAPALPDSAVWLTQNHRFDAESGIGRLARHIHSGQAGALLAALRGPPEPGVHWLDDDTARPSSAVLAHLHAGYAPYWGTVQQAVRQAAQDQPTDPGAVHAAFNRFRVLCAVQAGPWGVHDINRLVSHAAHAHAANANTQALLRGVAPGDWYAGRAVMVLRNDPTSQLFNGDIGIALPAASTAGAVANLLVYFASPQGGWRGLSPLRLPEHQDAFAMTVHKAQGSEFDEVLLLLPAQARRALSRELLYTGVTRARLRVTLAGSAAALTAAVQAPTRRRSGLLDRVLEAAEVARAARDCAD